MKRYFLVLFFLQFLLISVKGVGQNICKDYPDPDWSFNQGACTSKTIEFYTDSTNVSSYLWEFGDGQTSTLRNPIHDYSNYDIYSVSLTITYKNGCIKKPETKKVAITADKENLISTKDTTICSGQSINISTAGNGFDSCWESNSTLIQTTNGYIAKPTKTTTYVFKVRTVSNNLVVNGDFSSILPFDGINAAIPVGFKSEYFYYPPNNLGPGSYTIGTNSNDWLKCCFASCSDHTSKSGNMMIIDGADVRNQKVWYTTINIKKNTNYLFSTWLQTVNNYGGNLAFLQFSINDQIIGKPIFRESYYLYLGSILCYLELWK